MLLSPSCHQLSGDQARIVHIKVPYELDAIVLHGLRCGSAHLQDPEHLTFDDVFPHGMTGLPYTQVLCKASKAGSAAGVSVSPTPECGHGGRCSRS